MLKSCRTKLDALYVSGKVRLVLRGRDEVERVFEVSSGGHRGRDIPQCTYMDSIFTLLLWGNTFYWQCYVFS